jgi:hypothetical protein
LHEGIAIGRKPVSVLNRTRHGCRRCKVGAQMRSPLSWERASMVGQDRLTGGAEAAVVAA